MASCKFSVIDFAHSEGNKKSKPPSYKILLSVTAIRVVKSFVYTCVGFTPVHPEYHAPKAMCFSVTLYHDTCITAGILLQQPYY